MKPEEVFEEILIVDQGYEHAMKHAEQLLEDTIPKNYGESKD